MSELAVILDTGLWIRMDPHSFSHLVPDSPSICWSESRSENWREKLKKCKEIGDNWNFTKKVEVNLDQLHCFLLLSNLFCLFNSRKLFIRLCYTNLLSWIWIGKKWVRIQQINYVLVWWWGGEAVYLKRNWVSVTGTNFGVCSLV